MFTMITRHQKCRLRRQIQSALERDRFQNPAPPRYQNLQMLKSLTQSTLCISGFCIHTIQTTMDPPRCIQSADVTLADTNGKYGNIDM